MMTKGYVPEVNLLGEQENEFLQFYVAGRDSMTNIKIGGWKWTYALTSTGSQETKIAITYEWSLFMSFLSAFTVRRQAANDLIEAAMALEALALGAGKRIS